MINALHLLWIVPLSASIGLVVTALCVAAKWNDRTINTEKESE